MHTDLSPENVLVDARGALAGVIDFGGLGVGDPAVDLLYAWDLFDAPGRAVFARAAGADEALWARSRAWVFAGPGLLTLANYRDTMPERTARLTRMVEAVAGDSLDPVLERLRPAVAEVLAAARAEFDGEILVAKPGLSFALDY